MRLVEMNVTQKRRLLGGVNTLGLKSPVTLSHLIERQISKPKGSHLFVLLIYSTNLFAELHLTAILLRSFFAVMAVANQR